MPFAQFSILSSQQKFYFCLHRKSLSATRIFDPFVLRETTTTFYSPRPFSFSFPLLKPKKRSFRVDSNKCSDRVNNVTNSARLTTTVSPTENEKKNCEKIETTDYKIVNLEVICLWRIAQDWINSFDRIQVARHAMELARSSGTIGSRSSRCSSSRSYAITGSNAPRSRPKGSREAEVPSIFQKSFLPLLSHPHRRLLINSLSILTLTENYITPSSSTIIYCLYGRDRDRGEEILFF